MEKLKNSFSIFMVLALSYWAVRPFFAPGFFSMHDNTQVARVYEMSQALLDGMFPVRWVSDLGYGYGYPIFNFYAPLPYYFGGFFLSFGMDALVSTKAMMILGVLLSSIFMYLLAKEFWGKVGGVVSALFYGYAPYHAVDTYVRGAVGEIFAYAFLPFLFYSLWKIYQKPRSRYVIFGAFGFAGVILSHNLITMMLAPYLLIVLLLCGYALYKEKKTRSIRYPLCALLLGMGLSAFYWIPAILEIGYTNVQSQVGGGADFRDHFVCWQQLWNSPWGFGGSAPGCIADGLSLKIGKMHIITAAIGALFTLIIPLRGKSYLNDIYHLSTKVWVIFFSLLGIFLSIFFMTELSLPAWEFFTPMSFIQYPWRFLVYASLFASFLAGSFVAPFASFCEKKLPTKHWEIILAALSITAVLFVNIKFFAPQYTVLKNVSDYVSSPVLKWDVSKISDEYMPKGFNKPLTKGDVLFETFVVLEGDARLIKKEERTQRASVSVIALRESDVLIKKAPFPFWQVSLDGVSHPIKNTNRGIEVTVPYGTHTLDVFIRETSLEKVANAISLISLLTLLLGILYRRFILP